MIWWRRTPPATTIDGLYGTIVAQARLPIFYTKYGVPDTVEGRFEMIVLHQALATRCLARETTTSRFGAILFDRFCRDLDHNLREMGVGDLTIPKRMRAFGEAYFGRARAYDQALTARDGEACALALTRNVYGTATVCEGARRLARYVEHAARQLDALDAAALTGGQLRFPDPNAVPEAIAA
jgi:cytochrome b pre-mRNA-processing protein 3